MCTYLMINKDMMHFLFQSICLLYWISNYDHMMLSIRLGFHIVLIIIALHVVILVWGRYNSFWRSLWVRGARGGRRGRRGLKGCLDQPSFFKVWTILIYENCLYMLAEHYTSTFQPQYIDGLLNPSHRKLSFTTSIPAQLHWNIWNGCMCLINLMSTPIA